MDDWEFVKTLGSFMPEDFGILHGALIFFILIMYTKWGNYSRLLRRFDFYQGYHKVHELLTLDDDVNPQRLFDHIGMTRSQFLALTHKLRVSKKVKDGSSVSIEEKLMLFLCVCKRSFQYQAGLTFNRAASNTSKAVNEVLTAIISLKSEYVSLNNQYVAHIVDDYRYRHFFDNGNLPLGAFDGTHIGMNLTNKHENCQRKWWSTEGPCTNVFAAINFILEFVFVFAGWEGSAHDSRVLTDARNFGFREVPLAGILYHFYWLADKAYSLSPWCLTPFMGQRYHLGQFDAFAPATREELFNFYHASLRNYIERGFGILKKRYPILLSMNAYSLAKQIKMIEACFILHNFIIVTPRLPTELEDIYLKEAQDIIEFEKLNNANILNLDLPPAGHIFPNPDQGVNPAGLDAGADAVAWRYRIADAMWADYLAYRQQNDLAGPQ